MIHSQLISSKARQVSDDTFTMHLIAGLHKAPVLAVLLCKAGTCPWNWKHTPAGHFLPGTISPFSGNDLMGWSGIRLAVCIPYTHSCGLCLWQTMLKSSSAKQRLERSSAVVQESATWARASLVENSSLTKLFQRTWTKWHLWGISAGLFLQEGGKTP